MPHNKAFACREAPERTHQLTVSSGSQQLRPDENANRSENATAGEHVSRRITPG